MTGKKDLLGKIFISHSSLDKPFVRKLQKRLEKDGYDIWLDEKELMVGDPLSSSIFEAIEKTNIFLIIISSSAIKSKWLKFELNAATDKMVQGQCRVIPIVIERVSLPSEVRGLLYSDFTSLFKDGYKQIISALEYEYQERKMNLSFWGYTKFIAEQIFGSIKYTSVDGPYKNFEYSGFDLPFLRKDSNYLFVVFEIVPAYSRNLPLDDNWWDGFQETNQKNDYEQLFLVISERKISFSIDSTNNHSTQVKTKKLVESKANKQIVVFVDLFAIEMQEWSQHIQVAKDALINYANVELQFSENV